MRIAVVGASGMLGSMLIHEGRRLGQVMVPLYGPEHGPPAVDITSAGSCAIALLTAKPQVVINCAGIIPERASTRHIPPWEQINVNAAGPHVLAAACAAIGVHLLHVSTDCVFEPSLPHGKTHHWMSIPNALDLYGRAKALGEPEGEHVTVVRTSFIGPEHGLWGWFASQPIGAEVHGWSRAHWSGSTARMVARGLIIEAHARTRQHIAHLAMAEPMTKLDVLRVLQAYLKRSDIQIRPTPNPYVNRALRPTRALPPLWEALAEETVAAQEAVL